MIKNLHIRLMQKTDINAAEKVLKLAFATFLEVPDPETFMGDISYVRPRWLTNPDAALVAVHDHEIIASCFISQWGSFGSFGPLTVRPDYWDKGVAQRLLDSVVKTFEEWQVAYAGIFTFPNSPKHLGLYQKYGFWPQYLTAIMGKAVSAQQIVSPAKWQTLSSLPERHHDAYLLMCRDISDQILPGLDLSSEIKAVNQYKLGDTLLLWEQDFLVGFAVCHHGVGTEAGSGHCYIKFAAVRPGDHVERDFPRLLEAVETYARNHKLQRVSTGINTARTAAYHRLQVQQYKIERLGVAMQFGNDEGYCRPDVFVLDDWR